MAQSVYCWLWTMWFTRSPKNDKRRSFRRKFHVWFSVLIHVLGQWCVILLVFLTRPIHLSERIKMGFQEVPTTVIHNRIFVVNPTKKSHHPRGCHWVWPMVRGMLHDEIYHDFTPRKEWGLKGRPLNRFSPIQYTCILDDDLSIGGMTK